MSNGYPANFIDSIVHRFLSKQFSNTDVIQPYGPHKRRVYLCLPYVGELATNKFARQIRRLIAKIFYHCSKVSLTLESNSTYNFGASSDPGHRTGSSSTMNM